MRKKETFSVIPIRLTARDRAVLEELAELHASSLNSAVRWAIRRAAQSEKHSGAGIQQDTPRAATVHAG